MTFSHSEALALAADWVQQFAEHDPSADLLTERNLDDVILYAYVCLSDTTQVDVVVSAIDIRNTISAELDLEVDLEKIMGRMMASDLFRHVALNNFEIVI